MIKQKQKFTIFFILFFLIIFLLFSTKSIALMNIQSEDNLIEIIDPQIQRLKDEIQKHQQDVEDLQKQQTAYEESIKIKRREISSLKNQIGILDDTIAKIAIEIQTIHLQIEQTNLEVQNLELQIEQKNNQILNQKNKIANVLRNVDRLDRKKSHLEILVVEGTLSSFFKELNELQLLESNLKDGLNELSSLKFELEEKKVNLETRKQNLDNLQNKLLAYQEKLAGDKTAKDGLLLETNGQESLFQKLLNDVKLEQFQIESEIQNLEVEARKKLLENQGILPSDNGFIWPVASRKITSYFHDPDYPFRYIFEHPAIDIGDVSQGTAIRAARSGYVAKVKSDGSSNYGYILIVHTGGISTVYGHISKSYIKEDDFVVQGEVIALSGGMPGMAGSGRLTTGPHLHFEIRLNGIPVDPLKYLP